MESEKKWYQEIPPQQKVEAKLGKDFAEAGPNLGQGIGKGIEHRILEISDGEGSSGELKEQAEKYLGMWREFESSLFARITSENMRSPEIVETAIKGANALMSPEITKEGGEAARRLIEVLQKRYGIK